MKSFFEFRESASTDNLTEATVSRSDFEKLKKGMRIEIDFDSSISSSQKRVFTVKSTSRSAKYNVDKINMTIDGRGKYHLYSRGGKDATLALGNMAATIKSYKILGTNESVELDEAVDFAKMSKELLKHKSKGIEFEKAAAYIRLIHNNSAVSVQDKAFMALTKMLKDMDDLVKKTTITKILKDNGFKVRGGSLMREEVELLDENYRTLATLGMGAETKNSINVGRDVDYYEPKNGDKRMGKITKMTKSGYVVKDEKDGKSHTFTFHDRVKAKSLIAKRG